MGYIASASTIYARAYLTSRGREYLFNNDNIRFDAVGDDLFEIRTFTLGDPDVNYETTTVLPEGYVPDVSGKYDSCLKTALNYEQRNLLFFENFDQVIGNDIAYVSDANGNVLNININLNDNDIPVGVDGPPNAGPGGGGVVNVAPAVRNNGGGAAPGGAPGGFTENTNLNR